MRETGIDMWLILCYEDNLDPLFPTFIPPDTWCPILQILVFYLPPGGAELTRLNLSLTDTGDLYERPWQGTKEEEQWEYLVRFIAEKNPQRIGINIGRTQWLAGGLAVPLYEKLRAVLPEKYIGRLTDAEELATRWAATLSDREIDLLEHAVRIGQSLLDWIFSRAVITPGATTISDLEWAYREKAAELGLDVSFKPYFFLIRSPEAWRRFGEDDRTVRPGDFLRSDVGIRYLGLCTDHQRWAYVRRSSTDEPPPTFRRLLSQANKLQDIFLSQFQAGLTGNELLRQILASAREAGLPEPKVYSHSLGHFLHEPGPLIGLPWEQARCPGRGDVPLRENYAFTMELSVTDEVPEWEGKKIQMALEEDIVFQGGRARILGGRQTGFYLI